MGAWGWRVIVLARQLAALPGAPTPDIPDRLTVVYRQTYFRDDAGLRWIDVADRSAPDYEFVLDLEDAATGGVMLARLGVDHGVITTTDGWSVCNHRDPRAQVYTSPTLALALARVLIARGGWDG